MSGTELSSLEGSPSIAPAPRLSGRAFTFLLVAACLVPLMGLSVYATFFGRASDAVLPVEVGVGKEPVEAAGGQGAVLTDILWLESHSATDLTNVTLDINGQYYLYRQSPLRAGERLVLPQQIFSTKSSQRWVPGRYPITEITVTAKLPSGRRGVKTFEFDGVKDVSRD
ncbi:MAG: hypothetical protein ACO1RT_00970 [Planctomycetaceae bacterium]